MRTTSFLIVLVYLISHFRYNFIIALQYLLVKQSETGETVRYEAQHGENLGVFVFAGYQPATGLFPATVGLDEKGYLITDRQQRTSVPGVYGAGDVCVKELRQVVTAVSDGAVAATSMEKYLFALYEKLGLKREEKPVSRVMPVSEEESKTQESGFLTEQMKETLRPVFKRLQKTTVIKVYLDDSKVSGKVRGFMQEMEPLSEKVRFQIEEEKEKTETYPCMALFAEDGTDLGVRFHGVPGGHEFNSFIIALYNAGGPGQPIDPEVLNEIRTLEKKIHMQVAVSPSCTMCPEVVMASQRIALENPLIEAEMFDLAHYPGLKEQYQIMSVPCLIVNNTKVYFGKKSIREIVKLLKETET